MRDNDGHGQVVMSSTADMKLLMNIQSPADMKIDLAELPMDM